MPRAFIAIRPPDAVLDAIAERMESVEVRGGRATTREQWHVTIRFLGNHVDVDAVESALARRPLDVGSGEIEFGGAGALGSARRARVLVLKVGGGVAWARELSAQVGQRILPLGYEPDEHRVFVPHLTLARFREPTDVRALCAEVGTQPVGSPWRVTEVVVFQSELHPDGARHTARTRVALDQR
jgi:2'-5' RNA ligase